MERLVVGAVEVAPVLDEATSQGMEERGIRGEEEAYAGAVGKTDSHDQV